MDYDEYQDEAATIYAISAYIFVGLAILGAVGLLLMLIAVLIGMAS